MLSVVLAAFLAVGMVTASSSSSSCTVPSVIYSNPSLPATIATEIGQAYSYAADVTTIGSIISAIALTEPSITTAEEVIESYEPSYASVISWIETVGSSPSVLPPSSVSSFSYLTYIHSTLASAIDTIVSIEAIDSSLASVQSTFESLAVTQPSILTYLTEYTYVASPSLYAATLVIDSATITSPSIVATYFAVSTAVSSYSAVSSDRYEISSQAYSLPSTVVYQVIDYILSPSTVSPSVVSSLYSCYYSLYTEIGSVVEFTYSHSSVVTPITNLIAVEATVSSVSSAMSYIASTLFPTFTYQTSAMVSVISYLPSVYTDVDYLNYFMSTSPTFSYAISTIEETFYESPSVAIAIYNALVSPSTVTNPTTIAYEEVSHQSFVSAVTEVISFESAYYSYGSTISSIICSLTTAFQTDRTLITAVDVISAVTSVSTYSASVAIQGLLSVESGVTTILSYVNYVTYYSPSLSCYEDSLESFAYSYPYYVSLLWSVYNSPSLITSSFSYYSYLEAEYSTAASDMYYIVSAEVSYPSLSTYESGFLYAAEYDSSCLTEEDYQSYSFSSDEYYYAAYSS